MKKAPSGAYSVGGGGSGIQWVTPYPSSSGKTFTVALPRLNVEPVNCASWMLGGTVSELKFMKIITLSFLFGIRSLHLIHSINQSSSA